MSLRTKKKLEGQVSSIETRDSSPIHGGNGALPLRTPDAFDPAASRDDMMDSDHWGEWQEAFAHATDTAGTLTDGEAPPCQDGIGYRLKAADPTSLAFAPGDTVNAGQVQKAAQIRLAEEFAQQVAMVVESTKVNRALREADRLKDEFFAVVGHELRSPLATISNAMQVVRLKGLADPEIRSATEVIERQVQQMTRLVDDLVDISRVRQGKIRLQREVLDLRTVVARAVETSRAGIDARKHHLMVSLPGRAIEVDGDLTRLAQVVSNLLNNSARYTEEGGRIELSLQAQGDEAILHVRDTGIGIAPAHLPTIFDLFTQVQGNANRSENGLGIGLSLVRNMVELHGGRVQALSGGLGLGSEFVVRLPLSPAAHPSTPSTAVLVERTPKGSSRRILIIEDNRDAADTMATLLRVIGHEVWTAYDGPTALDLARLQPPEVVLCDISMPGMGGLEVAQHLRHDLGLHDALVVAVTGYGQERDKFRSQQADFDAHLVKPASLESLRALLGRGTTSTLAPS
jgi:signal transduction histidine kinase/ActR/RegA family two-component response regulator